MSKTINWVKLKEEEQRSRRFYWLLLLSPFVTVACAGMGFVFLPYDAPFHLRLIAAGVPGLFFALLLFGWLSPHLYVRRHMQQALLLAGLRLASGLLFLGLLEETFLWFLSNGSLWLFGSIWGWSQVVRGDCWLMRRLGEGKQLPRPWTKAQKAQPSPAKKSPSAAQLNVVGALDGRQALSRAQFLLDRHQVEQAVVYLTAAFRAGPVEVRQQAVARLEAIGEVELF
jgi:hypothetical protein